MSLLAKCHKRTGKWKIWTTISDAYLTEDWLATEEIRTFLRQIGSQDAETFPAGWYDKDTFMPIHPSSSPKCRPTTTQRVKFWNESLGDVESLAYESDRATLTVKMRLTAEGSRIVSRWLYGEKELDGHK